MTAGRFERFAPITGVLFFVFSVAGLLLAGPGSPSFPGSPPKYVTYYTGHTSAVLYGSWLSALGVFFLLWFTGSVTDFLRAAEVGTRLTRIAQGGGVAGSALLLAGFVANMVPAIRADSNKTLTPDVAVALGDVSTGLTFIAAPFALAAFLGATAIIGLRTGVLPTWFSWVTGVIALGLLVVFIAFAVLALFTLWVLAMAVLLQRRTPATMPAVVPPT